jgi:hypothetical protein
LIPLIQPGESVSAAVYRLTKAVLTAKKRKKLKRSQFALPGKRYPVNDAAHARNALSRVSEYGSPGEKAAVKRKVKRKFPGIGLAKAANVRLKSAEVTRLSLCRRGKTGLRTLYKADGTVQIDALVKAVDEGTLLTVMYAPERPDADGHVADQAVVRQMLHSLMRNGAELDIEHDGEVLGRDEAYVSEAFTVQKGDERFQNWTLYDGTPAGDLTGAAAVQIQIDDPELRASRLRGEWDGVSLFGAGEGVPEMAITKASSQDPEMTPEQLTQVFATFQTSLVKAITDLVKPAPTPEPPAIDAPKFEGDPLDPKALETYERALRGHELRKAVAGGTMTADKVAELRKSLAESSPSEIEAGIEQGDSPEVKTLKMQLFKAQRRSNAPLRDGPQPEKNQVELDLAEGLALAKSLKGESAAVAGWRVH